METDSFGCAWKNEDMERPAYTYMVECADGSLYTGWTYDLDKRMRSHNSGKGSKYTRSRLPVKLVQYEFFDNKIEAMKREYAIKHIDRTAKLKLIKQFEMVQRKKDNLL